MIIGHIGVRKGSKGLPKKNLKEICGKPLIQWSIDQLRECKLIDHFIISTDCSIMYEMGLKFGAIDIGLRDEDLSSDFASKWNVWQDSLKKIETFLDHEIDLFIDLDATSPLRDLDDISNIIQQYNDTPGVDLIMSCCEARKNPYFNLLEHDNNGNLTISKVIKGKNVVARQQSPIVLEHVASLYAVNPKYLKKSMTMYGGNVKPYLIDPSKSYDIDSELDYKIVEFLLKSKSK